MKTLAELKRDAQTGRMILTLTERYGSTDIIERLQGDRPVVGVNTVALKLMNKDGQTSELRLDNAKLTEYDGDTLTIYNPAYRDLTDNETKVLVSARAKRDEYDKQYPFGNGGYWLQKDYIAKSDCPWMEGYDFIKGKKYDQSRNKVVDKSIKGDAILRYKVTMA